MQKTFYGCDPFASTDNLCKEVDPDQTVKICKDRDCINCAVLMAKYRESCTDCDRPDCTDAK